MKLLVTQPTQLTGIAQTAAFTQAITVIKATILAQPSQPSQPSQPDQPIVPAPPSSTPELPTPTPSTVPAPDRSPDPESAPAPSAAIVWRLLKSIVPRAR